MTNRNRLLSSLPSSLRERKGGRGVDYLSMHFSTKWHQRDSEVYTNVSRWESKSGGQSLLLRHFKGPKEKSDGLGFCCESVLIVGSKLRREGG